MAVVSPVVQDAPPPLPATVSPTLIHPAYAPPPAAVQVVVNQPTRASHSLGIASLVLGIVCLLMCWLPFVNVGLAALGLLLGIVGIVLAIVRKGSGVGFAIAGTAVSLTALVLGLVVSLMASGVVSSVRDVARHSQVEAEKVRAEQENHAATGSRETPEQGQHAIPGDGAPKSPTAQPQAVSTAPDQKHTTEAPQWTDFGSPAQIGSIRVRITSAEVGQVPLHGAMGDSNSTDALLTIWMSIENTTDRKKVDYRGYMNDMASLMGLTASLTDDAGNRYKLVSFSGLSRVNGSHLNDSIYPGKSIADAVVFELPVSGAQFLRLTLAGKAFGEDGEVRFQIPRDKIKGL